MSPTKNTDEIWLLHHWMEFFRGGEAVLEQFGRLFPEAPIAILLFNPEQMPAPLRRRIARTSFLQHSPVLRRRFRRLLPFFAWLIPTLRIPERARFVLSSDANMIKGATLPAHAIHVCYCHSPPRYLWGMDDAYFHRATAWQRLQRRIVRLGSGHLRLFDHAAAQGVDRFIANSRCVQARIRKCYDRDSVVIHPPVNVARFEWRRLRESFYLIVSALVPYKRVDLAVDACTRLQRRLVVIGTGPEEKTLRQRAGPGIEFLGWQDFATVKDHYERCRAFLFPGLEDFGITPCEAQAAGAPVIAFGEGGALETVVEGVSGIFFADQTVASLSDAIRRFEADRPLDPAACRAQVAPLAPERFRREVSGFLQREYPELFAGNAA